MVVTGGNLVSAPAVSVSIVHKPQRHLFAWGLDLNGTLGRGIWVPSYAGNHTEQALVWQDTNHIVRLDGRWHAREVSETIFPPVRVLDVENIATLRCDMRSVDAVATDGQVWQCGGKLTIPIFLAEPFLNPPPTEQAVRSSLDGINHRPRIWVFSIPALTLPSPMLYGQPVPVSGFSSQPYAAEPVLSGTFPSVAETKSRRSGESPSKKTARSGRGAGMGSASSGETPRLPTTGWNTTAPTA